MSSYLNDPVFLILGAWVALGFIPMIPMLIGWKKGENYINHGIERIRVVFFTPGWAVAFFIFSNILFVIPYSMEHVGSDSLLLEGMICLISYGWYQGAVKELKGPSE